jgi:hypothetical protein
MAHSRDSLRRFEDLRVIHEKLEPKLRDVYTEARSDASLFRWYFKQVGVKASGVYAIDDRVEVDSAAVLAAGAEVGPRGRLVALAAEVASWGLTQPAVTCIVDADRDHIFGGPEFPDLLKTDGGSIEIYGFAPRPLQNFLDVVLQGDWDAEQLIETLMPVLNELFLIRSVLHLYGPEIPLIEKFSACCGPKGEEWEVQSEELILRSLAVAAAGSRRGYVLSKLEEARGLLPADRRKAVRGHDIAPLLIKALHLTNDWAKPKVLELSWRGCLGLEDLQGAALFETLRVRLT